VVEARLQLPDLPVVVDGDIGPEISASHTIHRATDIIDGIGNGPGGRERKYEA
jgi:hypothetical protein